MAVQYHTHTFDIPTASSAEAEAGLINSKVITPAQMNVKLTKSLNLSDLPDAATARDNLGIPDVAASVLLDDYIAGGYVDENTDVSAAFVLALATGKKIVGTTERIYGVDGNIDLGDIFHLENISVKQLDPGVNNRRTLTSSTCLYGRLTNVTVDRNGDGTYTGGAIPAIDDADIGIRIACAADGRIYIEGCTVTGDGFGGGIAVYSASGGYVRDCHIFEMKAGSPTYTAITDDVIEAIKVGSCQNFSVTGNLIHALTTEYTGHAEWTRFSRGVAVSGGSGVNVLFNTIYNVDQAVDISGNLFPKRINVYGNKISSSLTYGVKLANSAREVVVQGNNISSCGINGVVVSAPTSSIAVSGVSLANCSGAVTVSDNVFREIGDNNPGVLATKIAAVAVFTNHADYAGYPRNIRVFNNDIEGNGAMLYGIYSDVVYSSGPGIVEANNRIEVFGTARVLAVQYDTVNVYNSANFSVPNNAITAVAFTAEDDDNSAMIAVTSSTITIRRTGWYDLEAQVFWAANATGARQLFLYKGGAAIARARSVAVPPANDFTQAIQRDRLFLVAGDTVDLRAHQDSGGALDIRYEYTWLTVRRTAA